MTSRIRRRHAPLLGVIGLLAVAGCARGSDDPESGLLLAFDGARPGDTVGLIAADTPDGRFIEWIDRIDGTINRLDIDVVGAIPETIATIPVGTDGEQRGLLGQVTIGGRRYASWTQPDTFELVVGEVKDGGPGDIIWSAGSASSGAIGGVLTTNETGVLLLGLGRNTAWDAETKVGGAILQLDPAGRVDQAEVIISTGYTNPWAFTSTDATEGAVGAVDVGSVWVADNAAGPDSDDAARDDVERIGRADIVSDRNAMARITGAGRAPSAMIELPDGRIGICGFLDNELRAYDIVSDADGMPGLKPADSIMPCLTGAAVFADGTIVTAGETLQILRP